MTTPTILKPIIQPAQEEWTCNEEHALDKWEAIQWAMKIRDRSDVIYLDTETTGLHGAYLVEINIRSRHGSTIFDTLVKPPVPCEAGAERVHGITKEMLENAPTFPEIYPTLQRILLDKHVIIYNAPFDKSIIENCCLHYDLPTFNYLRVSCAMRYYAQYFGEWSDYWGNYKWQKLPGGGHRAASDTWACYQLVKDMAHPPYCEVKYTRMFPPKQLFCEWEEIACIEIKWKNQKEGGSWYSLSNRHTFRIRLPKLRWKHEGTATNRLRWYRDEF